MCAIWPDAAIPYVGKGAVGDNLTPREKLIVVLPLIAGVVIVLVYFGLFTSPLVIAVIFVLWVAVSLRNKRKFDKERDGNRAKVVPKGSKKILGSFSRD